MEKSLPISHENSRSFIRAKTQEFMIRKLNQVQIQKNKYFDLTDGSFKSRRFTENRISK